MTFRQLLAVDAPAGWTEVVVRTATTTVVGFLVFQVKEWSETGKFDTPDALLGAGWLALFTFLASALLKLTKS